MREAPVAEEQPVAAGRAGGAALLDEGAERRDAGAGADHDGVALGAGQPEMPVRLELDPHACARLQAVGRNVEATPARSRPWLS